MILSYLLSLALVLIRNDSLGMLTMLAQHLYYQATLSLIWTILNAHIAAVNACISSTRIARSAFEYRLQCTIIQLTCEAVATTGGTGGVEGIADEERLDIESK